MPRLKTFGSKEIIRILRSFGFKVTSQKGNRIKLVKETSFQRGVLNILNHKSMNEGTIKGGPNLNSQGWSCELALRADFAFSEIIPQGELFDPALFPKKMGPKGLKSKFLYNL